MNKDYYRIDNSDIPEIRVLPMDKNNEFKTYEAAVNFLTKEMVERKGEYQYKKRGMICNENSLVLFQYDSKLIGCARFLKRIKYNEPIIDSKKDVYKGYFRFDIDSIVIFDEPITESEIRSIDDHLVGLENVKQSIKIKYLKSVLKLIHNKKKSLQYVDSVVLLEEIDENDAGIPEGAKKQIIVNAYERNGQARQQCIDYYKKKNNGVLKCEICGFDFSKVYGEEFADCINVHHIIELSEIKKEYDDKGKQYKINPVKDLLPVCPNCHMILHSKRPAYRPEELSGILKFLENK